MPARSRPTPESSPAHLLVRHGLDPEGLSPVTGGTVNRVWQTAEVILRVSPRGRHAYEARVALGARAAGVRTPCPLAWGRGYSLWERWPGKRPAVVTPAAWEAVLDDLEKLQARPPLGRPRRPAPTRWQGEGSLVERTRTQGKWTAVEQAELGRRLGPLPLCRPPVFVHGDVYSANLLVGPGGEYLGLLDWGNAGWAPLEAEVCPMDDPAPALARWGESLDRALLAGLRLELFLKIVLAGRLPPGVIRALLEEESRV